MKMWSWRRRNVMDGYVAPVEVAAPPSPAPVRQAHMATVYRQGDVLLRKVGGVVASATAKAVERVDGRLILAYGEVTGHAHAIDDALAEMFTERDGRLYLKVGGDDVTLNHEEHATIKLDPGVYEVIHQREYDPARERRVLD